VATNLENHGKGKNSSRDHGELYINHGKIEFSGKSWNFFLKTWKMV
jgi:hypothetical protein